MRSILGRPTPGTARPIVVYLSSFAILLGLSLCWVVASPLSSVPDEPSHAIKAAAVVRGQLSGEATRAAGQTLEVRVPQWVAVGHELTCYAFRPEITPNCATIDFTGGSRTVETLTSAGNYNPVYYAIVGLPSLVTEGKFGLYAMRLTSAMLSCLFLAAMFAAAIQLRRSRWLVLAASVSITPMVLYLNGGINPNSLEFATVGAIFTNLALLLERSGDRRIYPQTVVWIALGAALLANTKALSLLWLLIVVVVTFWQSGFSPLARVVKNAWFWGGAALIGLASAFALWWVVSANSLESQPFAGAGSTFFQGLQTMFDRTFEYTNGLVGYFGWLDTPAPAGVLALWGLLVGTLLISALAFGSGRMLHALVFAIASYILLPPLLQAAVVTEQGFIWQGRYVLALFIIVLLAAGRTLDARFGQARGPALDRIVLWAVVLMALAHTYAFVWALRRYVSGLGTGLNWTDMIRNPAWQPPLGWFTWSVIYVVMVALAAWALYRLYRRTDTLLLAGSPAEEERAQPSVASPTP
ncbi:MAG TPA: DUF2142 domain-containing protein [Glaciibacter sp.]|nr:DUF2142 domain-containing protein [Glaciibacter sp.]